MPLHDASLRVLLLEGDGADPLPPADRFAAVHALLEKGFAVTRSDSRPASAALPAGPLLIAGRFPQTPPLPGSPHESAHASDTGPRWHRLEPAGTDALLLAAEETQRTASAPAPGAWLPWFPVIDYDRCTNCMQCLSFCLFGVYGVDPAGRIQAQQQDNCKTHCPACSRVCPEAAIMFPKYKAGPINGDVVSDSDLQREKMKIDISALLGGDVYSLLRDRSERARSRFSKERDADKALSERTKCLKKLGEVIGDIPPEVLASLPSPDEIARKAEEARQRTVEAQAQARSRGPVPLPSAPSLPPEPIPGPPAP